MVVIVSPSATIRKRWHQALKGSCPVLEIIDQSELRRALSHYKPTVLLLDSDAIRHRGIRHVTNLQQTNPAMRIILLTNSPRDDEAIAFLRAGVSGYCSKIISPHCLSKAIAVVKAGEIWADRKVTSRLIRSAFGASSRRSPNAFDCDNLSDTSNMASLSPRERDIASMIATGEQSKTISSHLSISEKTVRAHLTNIFQKLGVSTRTQLALLIRDNNFPLNCTTALQKRSRAGLELN